MQHPDISKLIANMMAEDIGNGDITTINAVWAGATLTAHIVARTDIVLAGADSIRQIINYGKLNINVTHHHADGKLLPEGTKIATLIGSASDILSFERIMLNLLYVTCSIATTTRRYVNAISGGRAKLLDTRKTLPALRHLSKYAALVGGACNHRMGLYDAVMFKDNHKYFLHNNKRSAQAIINDIKKNNPNIPIIYECDTLEEVRQGLDLGVNHILLDNMSPATITKAVKIINRATITEASGGITIKNIAEYCDTGVDYISSSAITMNPEPVDLGMDVL
jgi:nicotinate-nucleotide pyrophosphorylase (carboxylating)